MSTNDLERELRTALRETFDPAKGPHPVWAESPAAKRVTVRTSRRRWPLRLLAVAALVGAAAAALLSGAPDRPAGVTNGWIAYTVLQDDPAGGDPDLDIWFVALGEEPRRVVGTDSDSVDQSCPAFAPDGRRLAYGRVEGSGWDQDGADWSTVYRNATLVIADVEDDGTVTDRQTIEVGDGVPPPCPVWSPGGDQLAFGVPRTSSINPTRGGEDSEVWVVRLPDRRVDVVPHLLATDLDWSLDGSVLAIAGGVEPAADGNGLRDSRIHLYDRASGDLRSLESTLGASALSWSPGGPRLAYHTGDSGHELRLLDVETGREDMLQAFYGAIHGIGPVWSPDGETIVYQRMIRTERHEVVMVWPDDRSEQTGRPREVVIPPDDIDTGLFPWRVTWSPDGEYLLYRAWSYPNGYPRPCCGKALIEQQSWVAVPTDRDAPSVVLTDTDAGLSYDSPDTMQVQFQIWGRG